MRRFQGIYQICANSCIPASIENVIRYHGGNISQREFLDDFLKENAMQDLLFEKVKIFLDKYSRFTKDFKSEHKTIKDHKDINGCLKYIEECISHNVPLIIALNDGENSHVVTVHYIEGGKISYFDSNPISGGFQGFKRKEEVVPLFSPSLGTLVIKRK